MVSSRVESVLRVLYEDNHLLAVVKPARVPIQGDSSQDICLIDLAKEYLKTKYQKPGNVYLGLVHRLDRPVSGVVVFARTSKAASRLSEAFRSRHVRKIYRAVVEGSLKGDGTLLNYMASETVGKPVKVSDAPFEGAKEARLEYGVVKQKGEKTLLQIELLTGRKHQIRAQLAFIGHPIWGDKKYGSSKVYKEGEIALSAVRLEVPHPVKEERIVLEWEDYELPFE